MPVLHYLVSLRHLLVILTITLTVGFIEAYQRQTKQHLSSRVHLRSQPQLQGETLQELARTLMQRYPDRSQSNLTQGLSLLEQGKLNEARVALEQAIQMGRHDQNLLFLYARLLLDLNEDPAQIKAIVDELSRDFPRSRDKIENFFSQASKGKIRFEKKY